MRILLSFCVLCFFASCENNYLPKPKGYNRIDLPPHTYVHMADSMPYSFDFSEHAILLQNESWITERYWVDIEYPEMNATLQITYKPISNQGKLTREYITDSYRLTAQHNVKAYAIEEVIMELPNGDFASISSLEGEIPTPVQFHVTDSAKHFLRGALYFETATKNDSLAPVIEYLKEDLIHLLSTLKWND